MAERLTDTQLASLNLAVAFLSQEDGEDTHSPSHVSLFEIMRVKQGLRAIFAPPPPTPKAYDADTVVEMRVLTTMRMLLAAHPAALSTLSDLRARCYQEPGVADPLWENSPAVLFDDGHGGTWLGLLGVLNAFMSPGTRLVADCDDVTGRIQDFRIVRR